MECKSFCLLMAGILVLSVEFVCSIESNIIISKGYVTKLCNDRCRQLSETDLIGDCERGCRFFEYAETSDLLNFNETAFHLLCMSNCDEAYTVEKKRDVCGSGCSYAKQEVDKILEVSHRLLEDAEEQMSFLNSILGLFSSSFWSEDGDDNGYVDLKPVSGSQLFDLLDDTPSRKNKLDKMSTDDVEIINLLGDEMSTIDPAETTYCTTRLWLHRLSFILIVMGSLSLLFISIFYLLAFLKHKKTKMVESVSAEVASGNPPSYETLVKKGYIVVVENSNIQPFSEKNEKTLLD